MRREEEERLESSFGDEQFADDDSLENIVFPRPRRWRPGTYEEIGEFIGDPPVEDYEGDY